MCTALGGITGGARATESMRRKESKAKKGQAGAEPDPKCEATAGTSAVMNGTEKSRKETHICHITARLFTR